MEDSYYDFDDINIKKRKIIMIIFIILIFIGILAFIYYKYTYTLNIKNNIKFELGSNVSYEIEDYVRNKIIDIDDYSLNFNGVPIKDDKFSEVGTFNFKIKYKTVTKTGKIKIVDTTSPVVTINDLTIGVGEDIELDDFIASCDELSKPCNVTFQDESDEKLNQKAGEYIVRLLVTDAYNNETSVSGNLIVKTDYNSKEEKAKDLEISSIDPTQDDFENKLFLKFDKAIDEEEVEDNEEYIELEDILNGDLHSYLDSIYANNRIDETQLITAYNKSGYVVGYAVKVTLDNKKSFYLEK